VRKHWDSSGGVCACVLLMYTFEFRSAQGSFSYSRFTVSVSFLASLAIYFFCVTDATETRTCKADVVVGLPEGKAEELDAKDSKWRVSGK
jgi:hypothetical protein